MVNKLRSILLSMLLPMVTIVIILLLFVLYLPSQAANGIFTVNSTADTNDGTCNAADCTLREAILAANDTPEADIIVFSLPPSSTITLNGTQLPAITGTLTIDGNSAVNLAISGNNASRIFVVGGPPPPYPRPGLGAGGSDSLTLLNLTLRNGSEPLNQGGGIFNNGSLTIVNSRLRNLISVNGGVFNSGSLLVRNSSFTNNTATSRGGAIFNDIDSQATFVDSTFSGNSVFGPWATGGGAIYDLGGTMVISSSIFSMNTATATVGIGGRGGVLYSSMDSVITITDSTFSGNKSSYWGGAIMSYGSGLSIIDSSLDGNSSKVGGAIGSFNGLKLTNSTLSNNFSQYVGGAIHVEHGHLFVSNSTVAANSADEGGGIDSFNTDIYMNNSTISHNSAESQQGGGVNVYQGSLNFNNSIIANSNGEDCHLNFAGGVNVNNLVEDGTCNPMLTGDPLLGPLQDNGGDTLTFELLPGSPAIDQGHPDTCAAPPVNNLDQRGHIRPKDGDGDGVAICDIGSFELKVPDFSLVKTGPELAAAGEFINYTLHITSNLPVTVTNVVLTDTIPEGAFYISGGTLVGDVVSWTLPSLTAGSSFSRSFIVTATQTITNDDYRVSANGGYSTTGTTAVVTIVAVPITGLSASNDSPTILGNPTTLMATVDSGSDVSYAWDFGDVITGTGQNISHTYPGVGLFTAVVTASNPLGEFTNSTVVTILDVPITGMSITNDSPTIIGSPTTLMAAVTTGTNVSYTWDFGDGTTGSGGTVMHTYPDVGQYTAVVTASNTSGSVVGTTNVIIEQITIYMPVVLKSDSSANPTAAIKPSFQIRVAILPRRPFIPG